MYWTVAKVSSTVNTYFNDAVNTFFNDPYIYVFYSVSFIIPLIVKIKLYSFGSSVFVLCLSLLLSRIISCAWHYFLSDEEFFCRIQGETICDDYHVLAQRQVRSNSSLSLLPMPFIYLWICGGRRVEGNICCVGAGKPSWRPVRDANPVHVGWLVLHLLHVGSGSVRLDL